MAKKKSSSRSSTKTKSSNVTLEQYNYNVDHEPLEGHFARVTDGEHKGRYGVVETVYDRNNEGIPQKARFRTRDDDSVVLHVDYENLEPARAGGR